MLKNTSKAYPINFQAAGFAGLGGQINKDAFPNRFRRCTKDAVGQHQIFVHGYEQHVVNQAGIHFLN